jgi:hypothetical protein
MVTVIAVTLPGCVSRTVRSLDRFGFTLRFEYLPAVDEAALIVKRTGLTPKAADILVDFAGAARQQAKNGLLTQPPSLRQLFAWAGAVAKGLPVQHRFSECGHQQIPCGLRGRVACPVCRQG